MGVLEEVVLILHQDQVRRECCRGVHLRLMELMENEVVINNSRLYRIKYHLGDRRLILLLV